MSNLENAPFEVGDLVTTDFNYIERDVIRVVVSISKSNEAQSGWAVRATGGEPCKCCGKRPANPINGHKYYGVDSGWFQKVKQ